LEISPRDVIKYTGPLDLTGINVIADLDHPELRYPLHRSQMPRELWDSEELDSDEYFDVIKGKEILLHHPYESFSSSVVRFIETAALDPQVLAIKQTLYRTSGDSPIMGALIEAAQAGKQVLAVVEIRARFDELANVRWARKLEEAGVHVVYGLMGLKTHAKLSLVVRSEPEGIRRYCHVGTGNYNPKTARLYEDLGMISSDPELCDDLTRLFNQLSGFVSDIGFKRIMVAPKSLRSELLRKIEREIKNAESGKSAKIRFKLNSILDEVFVEALYRASQAGVEVDLTIRGICALRPGLQGRSEKIKVRSFLGRFLEHSRIYYFHNSGESEYWIGSADLMHRNLDRRIETLIKIENSEHKTYLANLLELYTDTGAKRWELEPSGEWKKIYGDSTFDIQEKLIEVTRGRK
jgi:polyphosphate kinase